MVTVLTLETLVVGVDGARQRLAAVQPDAQAKAVLVEDEADHAMPFSMWLR